MELHNKIIVIKVGSSLVTNNGKGIDYEKINDWARQISALQSQGFHIVLVSSGAIAEGVNLLGWQKKPKVIYKLQAAAAVGQIKLVKEYEKIFTSYSITTAQILLTHDDIKDRTRYLNAKITIKTLLDLGVVPIINENDTIATREIKLGDNDTLGALVTNLIDADGLIILTDCDGLFDKDPNVDSGAKLINKINVDNPILDSIAKGSSSSIGTGGMYTKVLAARRASQSGAWTVVASGYQDNIIYRILNNENQCWTIFNSKGGKIKSKQRWIKNILKLKASIYIDDGAVDAILNKNSSLLPIGCVKIDGDFKRGDLVVVRDINGNQIGRGVSNYNSLEVSAILKLPSNEIINVLGYSLEDEIIHKDNLVIYK